MNGDINNAACRKKASYLKMLLIAAPAAAALSVVLRTLSLLFFYDGDVFYYSSRAALPIISNIFFALAVLCFGVAAFLLIPGATAAHGSRIPLPSEPARRVALLPAAALAVHAASMLTGLLRSGVAGALLPLLSLVLAILSIGFFITLMQEKRSKGSNVLFGTAFILYLAVLWINSYTDFNIPLNSPSKLFFNFGCIGIILFVLCEMRAICGISKPRMYVFSLSLCILTAASTAIPSLIDFATGTSARYYSLFEDIAMLSVIPYSAARLSQLIPLCDTLSAPDEEPKADDIKENAEEKEADTQNN